MISEDGAQSWEIDSILWEEDADRPYKGDLGYPASVELANGNLPDSLLWRAQRRKNHKHPVDALAARVSNKKKPGTVRLLFAS